MNLKPVKILNLLLLAAYFLAFRLPVVFALDLDKTEVFFLNEDYQAAIKEAESLLVQYPDDPGLDAVYYWLGLSYLKMGNYLRAGDIFEIIINEYPRSGLVDLSYISSGDSYFLIGDFKKAEERYKYILNAGGKFDLKPGVYLKLIQIARKKGEWDSAGNYLETLSRDYPDSLEARLSRELRQEDSFFSVQAGAFLQKSNAESLIAELKNKGISGYLAVESNGAKMLYKVRSGKFASRAQAAALDKKLKELGYSSRVYP